MTTADIIALFQLPPGEASAYLANRTGIEVTYDWAQLWQDEHALAFTVSRLARADILDALYKGIEASVAGDMSRRDWTKSATELLKKEGWWGENIVPVGTLGDTVTTVFNARRLGLIFDTNITTAAAAGRWERLQSTKATYPYLTYKTREDGRVRAEHAPWNNVTLPIDHAWWKTHYPPNGWKCRCFVFPMRQKEVDADPNLITTAPPVDMVSWANQYTGLTEQVPKGIDPGWAYNAGIAGERSKALAATEQTKLAQWHPAVAAQYRADKNGG